MEHFDADGLIGFVVVEDDGGGGFFGFDDGGGVEAEVGGVGFLSMRCFMVRDIVQALSSVEDFDNGCKGY